MTRNLFYCSAVSDQAGEQPFGTASTGDVWLLLEYARPWAYRAIQGSDLQEEIKARLNNVLKKVPRSRLLMIKQERDTHARPSLFVVRTEETKPSIRKFSLETYEQLLDMNMEMVAASEGGVGGASYEGNLFLVCTHGKRDKCCAKFGFSLYKSLRGAAHDCSVWQSSHVGGDRFAANLVCFPHGLFYAHVTEDAGQRILNEYGQGRVVLENYRGRACYPSPIQAAEYFVRSESGLMGVDELHFLDYVPIRERNWRARFRSTTDGRTHEVYLRSRLSEFQNRLTCNSTNSQRVVQYALSEYRASV